MTKDKMTREEKIQYVCKNHLRVAYEVSMNDKGTDSWNCKLLKFEKDGYDDIKLKVFNNDTSRSENRDLRRNESVATCIEELGNDAIAIKMTFFNHSSLYLLLTFEHSNTNDAEDYIFTYILYGPHHKDSLNHFLTSGGGRGNNKLIPRYK